jgi:ketosteroid isomerase-like protein
MVPEYTDKLLATMSSRPLSAPDEHKQILVGAFTAVIQGNFDTFRDALASDVEFTISGFEPIAGTWRGRDEVVAAAKANFARLSSQKPVMEGMIADADSVAVLLRESGVVNATGEPYSARVAQWFTFAGGKIARIEQIASVTAAPVLG